MTAYQLLSGPAEILAAATIFLLSKSVRLLSPKISIITDHASALKGNGIWVPGIIACSGPNVSDILITKGIKPCEQNVADAASRVGIVCHGNLPIAYKVISSSREPFLLSNELQPISRRMHCFDYRAGILLAQVIFGDVRIVW